MPCSWGFAALLACWLLRIPFTRASPSLDFPVNAQVPPVAQLSRPYIFVFSASTFTSAEGPISYTLSGQPSWLQLISGTRTFTGTPGSQDVGAATFDLIAADNSGSTNASVTFVVLASNGPTLGIPILPQLASAGPTSGPASLVLRPLQAFAVTFEAGTFINTNSNTKFYAVSANNTPLPNWVQFDSSSLQFSGTSPPLASSTAAPQTYGIKLVASDVEGFSEANVDFQLIVAYHVFTSTEISQTINITPGKKFSSKNFRSSITLDGQGVADSDIISVTSKSPEWVHLDTSAISISGKPPPGTKSTNVTINIFDVYSDVLNIVVDLFDRPESKPLFTGTLSDANATAGEPFSYTINADLLGNDEVQLSANLGSASSWLQFSPQNRTLHGNVPNSLHAGPETITLTANEGSSREQRSFVIHVASAQYTSSSSTTQTASSKKTPIPSATGATSSLTSPPGSGRSIMSRSSIVEIVLATVLPVCFIVLIIGLILCRRGRRAHRRRGRHSASQETIITPEVSNPPIPEAMEVPRVPRMPDRSPGHSTQSHPPRIELPWAPDSMRTSRNRMSRRLRETPAASVDSTWGDFVVGGTESTLARPPESIRTVNPRESMSHDDLPSLEEVRHNYSRKKSTHPTQQQQQESVPPVPKRSSKRYSTVTMVSPGPPQWLSGAGHGAGETQPPIVNEARSSWQTTTGTIPVFESKRSTIVLDDFPSPPQDTSGRDVNSVLQARSPNRPPEESLRLVRNDSTRSTDLQRWYTDRARDKLDGSARFSSASSRPSSSSRVLWEDRPGGGTISTALMPDSGNSNSNTPQLLSGLTGGRRRNYVYWQGAPSSYIRTPSKLRRDVSTVSSGHFDSALSADSWEDENLIQEENGYGARHWQRNEADGTPSPRVPLETVPSSSQGISSPAARPRLRVADNRRPISVAHRQTKRSEKSEQGSLAFV